MARSAMSRAQRARLVRAWRTSGESQTAFARRHGVHARTFWGWCQAAPPAPDPARERPRFVPVRVAPPVAPTALGLETAPGLAILLPSGERVHVAPGTAPTWVAAIVAALRPAC